MSASLQGAANLAQRLAPKPMVTKAPAAVLRLYAPQELSKPNPRFSGYFEVGKRLACGECLCDPAWLAATSTHQVWPSGPWYLAAAGSLFVFCDPLVALTVRSENFRSAAVRPYSAIYLRNSSIMPARS